MDANACRRFLVAVGRILVVVPDSQCSWPLPVGRCPRQGNIGLSSGKVDIMSHPMSHQASGVSLPTATVETLRNRAQLIAEIRSIFDREGYFEVETPLVSADIVV